MTCFGNYRINAKWEEMVKLKSFIIKINFDDINFKSEEINFKYANEQYETSMSQIPVSNLGIRKLKPESIMSTDEKF